MTYWSAEQEALRASGRTFVEREVLPHLADWEEAQELPRALHLEAAKHGLLGVSFPEEVGGEGGGLLETVALTEAMMEAGASGGVIASLMTHGIALPHIVRSGSTDLVDRFVRPTLAGEKIGSLAVTEPDGGSDVAGIRTRAVLDGGRLRRQRRQDVHHLRGARRLRHHSRSHRRSRPPGLSLLVVERGTPGFEVTRKLEKLGWHCSDTAELAYNDVRVPAENLVGEEGSGFVQIATAFVTERVGLAVQGYSTAERCLRLTVDHATQRRTFGEPLVNRQVVRHKLVEMQRRVDAARVYTREVARRYDAGEQPLVEALHAKKLGVEAATYCVDEAVQVHGGTGYMKGTEVEMHYRDARILGIGGGANEVLDDLAAKLLGFNAGGGS